MRFTDLKQYTEIDLAEALSSLGIQLNDGFVSLDGPEGLVIKLPADLFINGDPERWEEAKTYFEKQFVGQFDVFEAEDPDRQEKDSFTRGWRRYHIGRRLSRREIEWRGIHSRIVNYYHYFELRAPSSMASVDWEKLVAIVWCILAIIGALFWFGIITAVTAGAGAAAFPLILTATGAICIAAVREASTPSKNAAQIRVWEAR